MSKTYFAILGLSSNCSQRDIQSAYRRLAKEYHPDHYSGGSGPFRRIQEAYNVLADPQRRSAYEQSLPKTYLRPAGRAAVYPQPEPLIPDTRPADLGEISPIRSFQTFSPSFEEIFEGLWNDFFDPPRSKTGSLRNLTLEVTLTREQARRGGSAAVMVPFQAACPTCRGGAGVGFYGCARCGGEGVLSGEMPVSVSFPAGLVRSHAVVIPMERFGINNLHLTVMFRPTDTL